MNLNFYNKEGEILRVNNLFEGQSVFLCGSGQSLTPLHMQRLKEPGIITCGLNLTAHFIRSNLWVAGDHSVNYPASIFKDPTIMKFVPYSWIGTTVAEDTGDFTSRKEIEGSPNLTFFQMYGLFNWNEYLTGESAPMGADDMTGRSVILAALRVLYELGFKNIYMIGVDFSNYELGKDLTFFKKSHDTLSVQSTSDVISHLRRVSDIFEKVDVGLYNCSTFGSLDDLKHKDFDEAIDQSKVKIVHGIHDKPFFTIK